MTAPATIRRVRAIVMALFLLYVPVVFGAAMFSYKIAHTYLPGFALGLAWMLAFLAAAIRFATLECPRGGHRFVKYNWLFAKKCARCGFCC